jgi:hypothetical protein
LKGAERVYASVAELLENYAASPFASL